MFRFFYTMLAFISLIGCNNTSYTEQFIEKFVPNNSEIIISINSLENFKGATNNNDLATITNLFNPLKKILPL